MKKYLCLFVIAMTFLAFKGYSNYNSYPKYQPRTITIDPDDKEEEDIFFAFHPTDGRDRPVWFECNRQKYGSKYHGENVSDKYPRWGM